MTDTTIQNYIHDLFQQRVAIRVYNEQTVPNAIMATILDTAWLSPSSVGLEGWRFIVLDRAKIASLKDDLYPIAWGARPQLDTASHFVFLIAEKDARYDSQSIKNSLIRRGLTTPEDIASRMALYQSFQENDMCIAQDARALWDWTAKQTYIAMGNMMTAAIMLGVDSCPIEGFHYDKVNALLHQKGIVNQDREGIASMVSFGYRLKDPKHPRVRKDKSDVITWL